MRGLFLIVTLVSSVSSVPALAQMPEPACASISDANLPRAFMAWAKPAATLDAAQSPQAGRAVVRPGKPVTVRLKPAAQVRLAQPPGQDRRPANPHAGLVALEVPGAGTWQVSASTPVWIEVIGPGGPVESTGFGNRAPCTGIRKVVDFPLPKGRHLLQLSGNPGPEVRILLSRAP